MDLLNENEIKSIVQKCGVSNPTNIKWSVRNYSEKLIGYLGEHLSLTVSFEVNSESTELKFFVKCIPRFNKWKANYLRDTDFFRKEYAMLSGVFVNFQDSDKGPRKWRPKLLLIREELFVFENVELLGYSMPSNLTALSYNELIATVSALARFHAQSLVYEEKKSQDLRRSYQIYEDFSQYLYEPPKGQSWRDTGMIAAMDFLKTFSRYKSLSNFTELVENALPKLFSSALEIMRPSKKYRNVIIHRDIWSNNIFLKKLANGDIHALLIDFQTVLYCPPMLDLSSIMYFNTTKSFRNHYTKSVIEQYYNILREELEFYNMKIECIIDKKTLEDSYKESLTFGITQALLIVPIASMPDEKKKEIFDNPETMYKINCVSRSQELIELAKENEEYRSKVMDMYDEVVERFIIPSVAENVCT